MMAPTETSNPSRGLSLEALARALVARSPRVVGDASLRVFGVQQDSRRVAPGDLFVARAGRTANGAAFALDAVARGAAAVLVERGQPLPAVAVPLLEVDDAAKALSFVAEAVYGEPSHALGVIGVTGTNGKTTTCWLVEHALAQLGAAPARLGTLGYSFAGATTDLGMTTPGADDVSRLLARTRDAGGTHFVMEVSSHAIAQERVAALRFEVAAFSNLTQDHLDFHGSLAAYGATKARLFTELSPRCSAINVDDAFGAELARRASGRVLSVSKRGGASLSAAGVTLDASGIHGSIVTPEGDIALASRLVGEHNLDNLLLAAAALLALGYGPAAIGPALAAAPQVPGRLERCDEPGDELPVLVDYAHTPDALERALAAVRALTSGRVLCVFGCGGDRDPQKRPLMGAAVARLADRAFLSNDNPRSEDPRQIAAQVEVGLRGGRASYEVELDRARAIERAVLEASAGDVVLIAGKGHEPYQLIGAERLDFDDRVQARRALAERRARAS